LLKLPVLMCEGGLSSTVTVFLSALGRNALDLKEVCTSDGLDSAIKFVLSAATVAAWAPTGENTSMRHKKIDLFDF
jgi:hypothetical protein